MDEGPPETLTAAIGLLIGEACHWSWARCSCRPERDGRGLSCRPPGLWGRLLRCLSIGPAPH